MLQELKNLNLDRLDEDAMVALLSFGQGLQKTYVENDLEAPDWLKDKVEALTKEIKTKRRDNLERALKQAQSKLETLKTAEEKRKDIAATIEVLKAKLG